MAAGEERTAPAGSCVGYAGASQSSPIPASRRRMARRSQTCTAGCRLVTSTRRDPSGLKGRPAPRRDKSGLSSRAIVRPVSASTRRMTWLASLTATSRPSGEKQSPEPPSSRARPQVPAAQSRQGGVCVISHFPSGLKATHRAAIDRQLGHLVCVVADPPDLGTVLMTAGRQPFPVGADGDVTAVVQRSQRSNVPRSGRRRGYPWRAATIRPGRSVGESSGQSSATSSRRGGPMRNSPRSGSSWTGHRRHAGRSDW